MPRQPAAQMSLLGAPMPSLMAAEGGTPSLMAVGGPVVLTIYQGDDKRWLFRLKQGDGSPFVLTAYSAALQFRVAVADADLSDPVTPIVEVYNAAQGEIMVTLPSESSVMLVQPQYLWDLEITHIANSWTTTIAVGTLTVTKEVTRTS